MSRTEKLEQQDIDAAIEREREGSHPLGTRLGHRAVREELEVTPLAQEGFEGRVNG